MITRYCPHCGEAVILKCYEDTTRRHKTCIDRKLSWWAKCPVCQTEVEIVERTEEKVI